MEKFINTLQELKDNKLPIYISGHICPDDDSIGSCLSMAYLLEKLGNHCLILLENKDTEILKPYSFNTKIINSVIDSDYVFIAMDLNETYRLGKFEKFFNDAKITFNIDHHQGNFTNSNFTLCMPEVSSTCEIIYKLIEILMPEILNDKELCQYLYTGMATDTYGFSRRLSPETLIIAQKLINSGINYEWILKRTLQYRTLYQFQALAKIVNELQYNQLFHYVIIDKSIPEYANLSHNDIVKVLAEELRKIDGIDILLVLEKYGDKVTAKVVSNISQNAHIIATHFGGGGHPGEAGFSTNLTTDQIIDEAKKILEK